MVKKEKMLLVAIVIGIIALLWISSFWFEFRFLKQVNKFCSEHDGIYAFPNTEPLRIDCNDGFDYNLMSDDDISNDCERVCNYVLEQADIKGIEGHAFGYDAYYPRGNYCDLLCD